MFLWCDLHCVVFPAVMCVVVVVVCGAFASTNAFSYACCISMLIIWLHNGLTMLNEYS